MSSSLEVRRSLGCELGVELLSLDPTVLMRKPALATDGARMANAVVEPLVGRVTAIEGA